MRSTTYFYAMILLLSLIMIGCQTSVEKAESTRGYIDERYKDPEPYTGPIRTGKQVYIYRCATCHDRTTQGAPLPDDDVEWRRRAIKGKDTLLQNVMNGYKQGLMPPKGGCRNCSTQELRAAIDYILMKSGVEITN